MMPQVSLIIFNRDGKDLIEECLDSVYRQTFKNFDILFVDDGSTDESVDFVRRKYKKVKIKQFHRNVGVAAVHQAPTRQQKENI